MGAKCNGDNLDKTRNDGRLKFSSETLFAVIRPES